MTYCHSKLCIQYSQPFLPLPQFNQLTAVKTMVVSTNLDTRSITWRLGILEPLQAMTVNALVKDSKPFGRTLLVIDISVARMIWWRAINLRIADIQRVLNPLDAASRHTFLESNVPWLGALGILWVGLAWVILCFAAGWTIGLRISDPLDALTSDAFVKDSIPLGWAFLQIIVGVTGMILCLTVRTRTVGFRISDPLDASAGNALIYVPSPLWGTRFVLRVSFAWVIFRCAIIGVSKGARQDRTWHKGDCGEERGFELHLVWFG